MGWASNTCKCEEHGANSQLLKSHQPDREKAHKLKLPLLYTITEQEQLTVKTLVA